MAKFDITVTEKMTTVYRVEARNGTEAAMKLGMAIERNEAENGEVEVIHEALVGRTLSAPRRLTTGDQLEATLDQLEATLS